MLTFIKMFVLSYFMFFFFMHFYFRAFINRHLWIYHICFCHHDKLSEMLKPLAGLGKYHFYWRKISGSVVTVKAAKTPLKEHQAKSLNVLLKISDSVSNLSLKITGFVALKMAAKKPQCIDNSCKISWHLLENFEFCCSKDGCKNFKIQLDGTWFCCPRRAATCPTSC